jgi:hypothetical protein
MARMKERMMTRLPTAAEIEKLVAFLPRLSADGFTPIKRWGGGTKREDGTLIMPWPEYDDAVDGFFRAASAECWCDRNYDPAEAARMLDNAELVAGADLAQIRTMLTYCVRGERFCDGHWGAMVEDGHVARLLERLAVLRSRKG